MRGSTAAGINISLLPRDCSCGEFACSAVWGRGLFLVFVGFPVVLSGEETFFLAFVGNLPLVLYWKRPLFSGVCWISGSAVWGRDFSPGICGEFADGAILEEASFPGICGIRHIRYRRGPSVVRNMRAVLKKASWGTRCIHQRHSV